MTRQSSTARRYRQVLLDPDRLGSLYDPGMEIKEWVKRARDRKGWSLAEMAEAMNRSKASAGFWESGASKLSYEQVAKISELTGEPMPHQKSAWPFPGIDESLFNRLSTNQKLELQGIVRRSINDLLSSEGSGSPLEDRKIESKKKPVSEKANSDI